MHPGVPSTRHNGPRGFHVRWCCIVESQALKADYAPTRTVTRPEHCPHVRMELLPSFMNSSAHLFPIPYSLNYMSPYLSLFEMSEAVRYLLGCGALSS